MSDCSATPHMLRGRRHKVGALVISVIGAVAPAISRGATTKELTAQHSVSYVFANELGSGVYRLGGRSLQVYRFNAVHQLREAQGSAPAVRLVAPLTFGFLDFNPGDVLEDGLPSRIDSFSVTPGIEYDFTTTNDWHVIPYVRAGASVASGGVEGWLLGAGLRLEHQTQLQAWDVTNHLELAFAAIAYRNDLSDDHFMRLRQGLELRRGLGWHLRAHEVEIGIYGIVDIVGSAPAAPIVPTDAQPLQFEFGVMLGPRPDFRVWRIPMPRLGLGYRFAGNFSGLRMVIGRPF